MPTERTIRRHIRAVLPALRTALEARGVTRALVRSWLHDRDACCQVGNVDPHPPPGWEAYGMHVFSPGDDETLIDDLNGAPTNGTPLNDGIALDDLGFDEPAK